MTQDGFGLDARELVVESSDQRFGGLGRFFGDAPVLVVEGAPHEALRMMAELAAAEEPVQMVHVLPDRDHVTNLAKRMSDEEAVRELVRNGVEATLHGGVIVVAEGMADRMRIERANPPMRITSEGVESLTAAMARVMHAKGEPKPHTEKGYYRQFEKRRPDGSVKRGRR